MSQLSIVNLFNCENEKTQNKPYWRCKNDTIKFGKQATRFVSTTRKPLAFKKFCSIHISIPHSNEECYEGK